MSGHEEHYELVLFHTRKDGTRINAPCVRMLNDFSNEALLRAVLWAKGELDEQEQFELRNAELYRKYHHE